MKIQITPAHDPDLLCEFEIPRKSGKTIEFTVPRMEYTSPEVNDKFDAWFADRMSDKPLLDDEGNPVLNEDGSRKVAERKPITDREVTLKMLEVCGVPKTTLNQLEKLTNGELSAIWKQWGEASKVTPGESDASATS